MYSISQLQFTGPYGRWHRAVHELDNPSITACRDPWVNKLKEMLQQRSAYQEAGKLIQYGEDWPLFHTLFNIYEDCSPASLKYLIEAGLCSKAPSKQIASICFGIPHIDGTFIEMYAEMFYNIRPYLCNDTAVYRYIVTPMLGANTNKLAMEHIWKLLAITGGLECLIRKGLGTVSIQSSDVDYMLQIASYRNLTAAMKYNSSGFNEEDAVNPAVVNLTQQFLTLSMAQREAVRNRLGLQPEPEQVDVGYGDALSQVIYMDHLNKYELALDTERDGMYDPNNSAAIEVPHPIAYIDEEPLK